MSQHSCRGAQIINYEIDIDLQSSHNSNSKEG